MSGFGRIFVLVMLLFSVAMLAYVPLRARLDFQLDDVARSLDTSRGRERKQQYEYDEVTAQLPLTQAELDEVGPQAEKAAETVRQLKDERKKLREEKKTLEEAAEAGDAGGNSADGAE